MRAINNILQSAGHIKQIINAKIIFGKGPKCLLGAFLGTGCDVFCILNISEIILGALCWVHLEYGIVASSKQKHQL